MSNIIQTIKEKLSGVDEYGKYEDPLVEEAIYNTIQSSDGELFGRDTLMIEVYEQQQEKVDDWEHDTSVEYPFSMTVMYTLEKLKDDGILHEEEVITQKGYMTSKISIQQEL